MVDGSALGDGQINDLTDAGGNFGCMCIRENVLDAGFLK